MSHISTGGLSNKRSQTGHTAALRPTTVSIQREMSHTVSVMKTRDAAVSLLTLLLVSRAGSCGLMQAWAILITCSSFLGCSSTLAARNNVVWEIICKRGGWVGGELSFTVGATSNYSVSQRCGGTYISMEFGEGVNHIKPVHINYSSVYNQLRAGYTVKAQHMYDS